MLIGPCRPENVPVPFAEGLDAPCAVLCGAPALVAAPLDPPECPRMNKAPAPAIITTAPAAASPRNNRGEDQFGIRTRRERLRCRSGRSGLPGMCADSSPPSPAPCPAPPPAPAPPATTPLASAPTASAGSPVTTAAVLVAV